MSLEKSEPSLSLGKQERLLPGILWEPRFIATLHPSFTSLQLLLAPCRHWFLMLDLFCCVDPRKNVFPPLHNRVARSTHEGTNLSMVAGDLLNLLPKTVVNNYLPQKLLQLFTKIVQLSHLLPCQNWETSLILNKVIAQK